MRLAPARIGCQGLTLSDETGRENAEKTVEGRDRRKKKASCSRGIKGQSTEGCTRASCYWRIRSCSLRAALAAARLTEGEGPVEARGEGAAAAAGRKLLADVRLAVETALLVERAESMSSSSLLALLLYLLPVPCCWVGGGAVLKENAPLEAADRDPVDAASAAMARGESAPISSDWVQSRAADGTDEMAAERGDGAPKERGDGAPKERGEGAPKEWATEDENGAGWVDRLAGASSRSRPSVSAV